MTKHFDFKVRPSNLCLSRVQVAEQEGVFEELNQADYDERQMARRDDDFIVDDEGFGYKDRGGEIWEVNESAANDAAKKKKRKLNVSQFLSE